MAEVAYARGFAEAAHAPATRRAYAADWRVFAAWCAARGVLACPATPEVLATFLAAEATAGLGATTLGRRLAAIAYAHKAHGIEAPTRATVVQATLRGIRRTLGTAVRQKTPLTADRLLLVLAALPPTLQGCRDRALLLLGFAGALRRSELAALCVEDLETVPEGLRVTIRRSKGDQEAAGQTIAVIRGARACPVAAVDAWLTAAAITEGPIFRRMAKGERVLPGALTPHSVGAIVKAAAARAGLTAADFGGHSLRAGFATSAAIAGRSLFRIMDVTRHKRTETLRGYVRRADEFRDHAGAGLL
ncbi:MAG: tyrosine-type recombinase/integrase [Deltaproteobacteria bacterium]|nr:tyrosine-type recombinase/integrase [Deltaproteobacteria bacterium]